MEAPQYKTNRAAVEVKAGEAENTLHIRAYALAFGNIDAWGDVIEPNACDAFLKSDDAARMKLCYQHDAHEVIGVITDKGVDNYGMWFEADILDTATGSDVQKLIKAGAINEFSIGYFADKYRYERRDGYDGEIRVLEAISIVEVSPVTRAANPKAILLDAKSEQDMAHTLRAMSDEDFASLKRAIDNEYNRRVFAKL